MRMFRTRSCCSAAMKWPLQALLAVAAFAFLGCAAPAVAQLSASATLVSDDLLRGESLSDGKAAIIAAINYDARSGAYAGLSATAGIHQNRPTLLVVTGAIGVATRLNPEVSVEFGVFHSRCAETRTEGYDRSYTELYLGMRRRQISAYLRYSPDYGRFGTSTIYGEASATIEAAPHWLVSVHAGVLLPVSRYARGELRTSDWSVGLTRRVGQWDLGVALTGTDGSHYWSGNNDAARIRLTTFVRWSL